MLTNVIGTIKEKKT